MSSTHSRKQTRRKVIWGTYIREGVLGCRRYEDNGRAETSEKLYSRQRCRICAPIEREIGRASCRERVWSRAAAGALEEREKKGGRGAEDGGAKGRLHTERVREG